MVRIQQKFIIVVGDSWRSDVLSLTSSFLLIRRGLVFLLGFHHGGADHALSYPASIGRLVVLLLSRRNVLESSLQRFSCFRSGLYHLFVTI